MKAVLGLVLVVVVVAVYAEEAAYQLERRHVRFQHWKKRFRKTYKSAAEEQLREEIFRANMAIAAALQVRDSSARYGETPFADMTQDEFRRYKGTDFLRTSRPRHEAALSTSRTRPFRPLSSLDWRDRGAVTPVRDLGHCSAGWAASAIEAVEGWHQIATNQLVPFSVQDLIDCSRSDLNLGCRGGAMEYAYEYIADKGITLETAYPYAGVDGTCRRDMFPVVRPINGYGWIRTDEVALLSEVQRCPVSVALETRTVNFQLYSGGVFEGPCGDQLDHGMLLVGYGTDPSGKDYWILKNSWGALWGENGYIRLGRGKNLCGIANYAHFLF
eukprot:Sspe_Gene.100183::Locus_74905_Transcript_1_1_Confidence_1.000_Length_1059::g.100183::m.100183